MAEPITLLAIGRPCAGRRGQPEGTAVEPVQEALDGVFARRSPGRPDGKEPRLPPEARREAPPVDEFDAHDRMPDLDTKPA